MLEDTPIHAQTLELERLIAAVEASRDAIWITNAQNRVILINSAFERLIGKQREQLLNGFCYALLGAHTATGESTCRTICPFMHLNNPQGMIEAALPSASGKDVWFEISYGCIKNTQGELEGIVHIARNLTERKAIERMKDEFVQLVSHELRTPLHHIKGFVSTLLQTDVSWDAETQRDFLESIDRETDRLTQLINTMLDFSRLEGGHFPMHPTICDVSELVDVALQRSHSLIAGRTINLNLQPSLTLYVDEREIELVIMNLIENAVKYSDPNTAIALVVEEQPTQIVFCVQDQGRGIASEDIKHVFERFYRVDMPDTNIAGTGLGLAICKQIVESHRGRIWAESQPGLGSHFYFSIPKHVPEEFYEEDKHTGR